MAEFNLPKSCGILEYWTVKKSNMNISSKISDFGRLVTRAYMLVKFGMDTEQIVANATNIFWMHSFISGHKKVEYIYIIYSETMFPSHTLQCSLPANIRRANHIAIALWLTARAPPAAVASRGDSVVLPLIRRKVPRDVHKCATVHIVYRIANPIFHNPALS